ncbi:BLUF domain-containing protein [Sphingomonas sp. RB3P16]|uniref:BLUF domain-containing protein n=1 Tax=Parasphingomonas frigoris TaxID=3096163 RepID=UPI002FC6BB0F
MERSLLYVSRHALSMMDWEATVTEIVSAAVIENESVGISGSLVCTHDHFAQLLEGPGVALDELMNRIERDQRHTDITVLRVEAISRRRLPHWSLAYSGPSLYVERQIAPLIASTMETNAVRIERLITLLVGLSSHVSLHEPGSALPTIRCDGSD